MSLYEVRVRFFRSLQEDLPIIEQWACGGHGHKIRGLMDLSAAMEAQWLLELGEASPFPFSPSKPSQDCDGDMLSDHRTPARSDDNDDVKGLEQDSYAFEARFWMSGQYLATKSVRAHFTSVVQELYDNGGISGTFRVIEVTDITSDFWK